MLLDCIIGSGTVGIVAGSYAHFAVYPTVLSSGTISSHYSAASESAYEALVLASAPGLFIMKCKKPLVQ